MNMVLRFGLTILVMNCNGISMQSSPRDLELHSFGDDKKAWFQLQWQAVPNDDEANPVIGYKVKVWEVKKVKTTKYIVKDGKIEQVEVYEIPDLRTNRDPNNDATVIEVPTNTTEAVYNGVKVGVMYEVGVQAYTANEDFPFASKMRVTFNPH